MRVAVLDKVHLRIARVVKRRDLRKLVILVHFGNRPAAALHTLKQQKILRHVLMNKIKREQRMTQVVQHAHEDHNVKALSQRAHIPYRHAPKLDVGARELRRKSRLPQVTFVRVNSKHALGPAPLHLQRIKATVATNIQHRLAG